MADGLTRALRDNGPLIVCWQMAEADQRVMVSLSLPINYLVQCLIVSLNYHFFYNYILLQKLSEKKLNVRTIAHGETRLTSTHTKESEE